jgi:hypothetical protein
MDAFDEGSGSGATGTSCAGGRLLAMGSPVRANGATCFSFKLGLRSR